MNWTDYDVKREQVKDYLREAEQDRMARRLRTPRPSFDYRCWLSSRVEYALALSRHLWKRVRNVRQNGEAAPKLAECN